MYTIYSPPGHHGILGRTIQKELQEDRDREKRCVKAQKELKKDRGKRCTCTKAKIKQYTKPENRRKLNTE